MRKRHVIKAPTLLEMLLHTSSGIAKAAFRTGNAAGFHGKKKSKQNRIRTRQEERNAQRGEHPEERGDATEFRSSFLGVLSLEGALEGFEC